MEVFECLRKGLNSQVLSIIYISHRLDEIFEIADRIAVISRGQLSQMHRADTIDLEQIGLLMAGAHESVAEEASA